VRPLLLKQGGDAFVGALQGFFGRKRLGVPEAAAQSCQGRKHERPAE
jgi:hypothetical protein